MPRKTVVTETVEDNDGFDATNIIETEQLPDQELAEADALDGLMSEFMGADGVSVNVYRQGAGKKLSFLYATLPEESTGGDIMERCRDQYGTGDYRLHIRKGNRLIHNRGFSVEQAKVPEQPAQQDNSRDIIALITAQMNQQQQMFMATMQAMAQAFSGRPEPSVNPAEMQRSLIESLVALKGLAVDEKPHKDPVEMLVQGITLAKELAGKEGETNSNDLLLEGLKHFAPVIAGASAQGMMPKAAQVRPMPQGQPRVALERPAQPIKPPADVQGPNPINQEEQAAMMEKLAMQQQLAFLVQQAKNGKNPALYAELLLDQVGEFRVLEFIKSPKAMDQLIELNPEVQHFRSWFENLKEEILILTGSEEVEDTGGNTEQPPDPESIAIPDPNSDSQPTGDT